LMNWEIENLAGDEGGVVYDEPGDWSRRVEKQLQNMLAQVMGLLSIIIYD
jgi:hypothetical protein